MTTYVTRDGSRLTPYMLYQINRLNADFKKQFGYEIKVTSGIRLPQEQIDIFLKRYVTAGNINGRKVYDTRVWRGVRYYRISSAGTVAVPGTSNHEIQGTNAAVDLRDTGPDAGVTVAGSKRSNWLKANASKYDLEPEGFSFGEAWHYKAKNINKAVPSTPAGGGSSSGASKLPWAAGRTDEQIVKDEQTWLNNHRGEKLVVDGDLGEKTEAAISRYENFLRKFWGYKGSLDGIWGSGVQTAHEKYTASLKKKPAPAPKTYNPFGIPSAKGLQKIAKLNGYKGEIDDKWGSGSMTGFVKFLKNKYGYKGGNTLGSAMWAAIARWLRAKWGYKGNDQPGPVMRAALKKANDANFKEL